MNRQHILPLLLIFPTLLLVTTAPPIAMVSASENENIPDTSGGGQIQLQGNGDDEDDEDGQGPNDVQCITAPCPTEPDGGTGGSTGSPPPVIGQSNRATSEQTGGISAGDIIQRSNTAVTEQYCKTIAGIGDRRCQQEAPEGAIQDCTAIAGLGRANCVQSENPDGSGTCLTANGRPYICETSTGKSLSGSGQAGQ